MRQSRHPRARLLSATVAVLGLLTLPACTGQPGPAGQAAGATTSATAPTITTETFDPPAPEPTTVVPPPPAPPREEPAIRVARLPVGGGSDPDPQDPRLQCAHVTWILTEAPIPRGFAVELAGFVFSGGSYTVVTRGCGTALPNCHRYILRAGNQACDLAVRAVPGSATGEEASLGLEGRVYCPVKGSPSCTAFLEAVRQGGDQSVSLDPPPDAPPEPPPSGSPSQSSAGTGTEPPPTPAGGPSAATAPASGSGTAGG